MDMLKRFARGLSSQVFKLSLFFLATSAATVIVFGSPDPIKTAIKDSGVYDKAVDTVLSEAKRQTQAGESEIPLDDPGIQKAVEDALPPEFIEQTAGGAIDGLFAWLQGKTESPQFTIDLNDAKRRLATGIGEAAYAKANTLPPCTAAQLRTLDRNDLDIFNLPCVPPGLDLRAEQAKLVQQISSNNEFLQDTTVTAEDLPQQDGQNAFDQAAIVPQAYVWLVRLPWILGVLALVSATGVILLHDERRRGVWVVGRTAIAVGVVLVISSVLVNYLAGQVRPEGQNELVNLVPGIIRDLAGQFNRILITFGIGYGVAGAATMLAIRLTRPKLASESTEPAPKTEGVPEPGPEPAKNTKDSKAS